MSVEFIQGEPPESDSLSGKHQRRKYEEEAAELRGRPGVWAVLRRDFVTLGLASKVARNINNSALSSFKQYPPEDPWSSYEATARTVDDEHRLYVRFVKG